MNKILVIGSLSTDFIVSTLVKPNQGETVFGESFDTAFGGKGANQAVAASRLGEEVAMMGNVGNDTFGGKIIDNLKENGVDVSNVEPVTHFPSGAAHIILHNQDNSIIVVPGANKAMTPERFTRVKAKLLDYDLVILQNEIPQETNEQIIDWCWENKVPVLYNPAPARQIKADMFDKITFLTPNEHEFAVLFAGQSMTEVLKKYPNQLIVTLGAKGAIFHDGEKEVIVAAFPVDPVDTTGAGDTFNGALAVGIMQGKSLTEAIKFANLAASLSVQGFGAQGGMPTLEQVEE